MGTTSFTNCVDNGAASRRRRVLVSAFALSPVRGSEAAVGWNVVTRLGAYCDVVALYGRNDHKVPYGEEVETYLRDNGPVPGVTFYPVDHPPSSRLCQKLHDIGLWATYYIGYAAWQRAAYRVAKRLHAERPFDLVHQLNMIGFREPGYLWRLGVPFFWGPIGGAACVPWAYVPSLGLRGAAFHAARNVINVAQMHYALRPKLAARAAEHLWAVSSADLRVLTGIWRCRAEQMLETGTAPHPSSRAREYKRDRPLRLAWSGNHEPPKALPLLLKACAQLPESIEVALTILGDGSETNRWKRLAGDLGLEDRITWLGRLSRTRALEAVSRCDAFVFTGLKEGTPHVVLEALSLGLPVVCHDACGMGTAVTPKCGIKFPMEGPSASVAGVTAAITRLATEPDMVRRLSVGALERATELSWETKVKLLVESYNGVSSRQRQTTEVT